MNSAQRPKAPSDLCACSGSLVHLDLLSFEHFTNGRTGDHSMRLVIKNSEHFTTVMYCPACGTPTFEREPQASRCTDCGAHLKEEGRVCDACIEERRRP